MIGCSDYGDFCFFKQDYLVKIISRSVAIKSLLLRYDKDTHHLTRRRFGNGT